MNTLQKSLLVNAIFSGLSGIILTVAHVKIATLFNLKNTTLFLIIGLVLLYFTGTILYEIKKQRKIAVQWIILQDFLWVLGSGIILIFNPFQISTIGNRLIGCIALIVLFMGLNQLFALKKTCKL